MNIEGSSKRPIFIEMDHFQPLTHNNHNSPNILFVVFCRQNLLKSVEVSV